MLRSRREKKVEWLLNGMAVSRFIPPSLPLLYMCLTKKTGRVDDAVWSKQHNSPSNLDVTLGWTLLLKTFFSLWNATSSLPTTNYTNFSLLEIKKLFQNKAYTMFFMLILFSKWFQGAFHLKMRSLLMLESNYRDHILKVCCWKGHFVVNWNFCLSE